MKRSNRLISQRIKQLSLALMVFGSRFIGLPANISLVGSFGFWNKNVWLYFASIVAFDYFKGGFYQGFWLTYLGFLSYFLLGRLAKNSLKRQLVFLPLSSFLFFLISNFGVWYYWYPHTLDGLSTCYLVALPFYGHTLIGDVLFGYSVILMRLLDLIKGKYLAQKDSHIKVLEAV